MIFPRARPRPVDPPHEHDGYCPYLSERIVLDGLPTEPPPGIARAGSDRDVSIEGLVADLRALGTTTASLADISIRGKPKLSDIVARVQRWGVVILPGLLAAEALEGLEREFARMIEARRDLAKRFKVDESEASICVRLIREKLDSEPYPEISRLFSSPVMRRIADACFGDSPYQFNHQIFVHRTDRTMSPPSGELHFDVTRMLKFWLYLSDGTQANGAMRAAPGSNLWLKHVRREYSDRLIPKSQIRNTVDESALRAIHLVGPPGTLFIFDTDVAHGASTVAQGGQRRIMRSHCTEDLFASRARLRGS